MRRFVFAALAAVALLGTTAAAVVGVAQSQSSRSRPAVLQAAWRASEQASPAPAAEHGRSTPDANGVNHQSDVSDEDEGPDEDDDSDQSDVSEHR